MLACITPQIIGINDRRKLAVRPMSMGCKVTETVELACVYRSCSNHRILNGTGDQLKKKEHSTRISSPTKQAKKETNKRIYGYTHLTSPPTSPAPSRTAHIPRTDTCPPGSFPIAASPPSNTSRALPTPCRPPQAANVRRGCG